MSFWIYISLTCYVSFPNAGAGGGEGDHQLNSNNRALFDALGPFVPHDTPRPK